MINFFRSLDRTGLVLLSAGVIAFAGILYFQKNLKNSKITGGSAPPTVASIKEIVESPTVIRSESTLIEMGEAKMFLRDRDVIFTDANARATIEIKKGAQLKMGPNTRIRFELWNPRNVDSPISIVLLEGFFDLTQTSPGDAFVFYNGRMMAAVGARYSTQLPKIAEVPAKPPLRFGDDPAPLEHEKVDPVEAAAAASLADESTLSTSLIEQRLKGFHEEFQRCRSNRLRTAGDVGGELLMNFTIHPDGKVKEVSIQQTNIQDKALVDCVVKVLSGVIFPSFSGEPISQTLPLNFPYQ